MSKQKIIDAINENDFDTLDELIDNGKLSISTCLFKFMIQKNLDGLIHLVQNKDATNVKYDALNILTIACNLEWLEGIEFLLQFEDLVMDTTQQSRLLYTPLFSGIVYEKVLVVEYLLKNHEDLINKLIPETNDTVFHTAISVGNNDILKLLVDNVDSEHKHLISHTNSKGWSPLHLAVLSNDTDAVKTLINGDADINIMDNTSKTPLELAFDNNFESIFNYLKEKSGGNYFESISLN